MGWQWPTAGSGALNAAMHTWDLLKDVLIIISLTSTIVWSQVKQQSLELNPAHQQKVGLKIY